MEPISPGHEMPRGVRSSVADDERRRARGGTSRVERRVSETLRRPWHVRRYGELPPPHMLTTCAVSHAVYFARISLKRESIIPPRLNRRRCQSARRSNSYPSSRSSIYPPKRDFTTAGATPISYLKRRCAGTIHTIAIFTSWYARGRPAIPRRARGKRAELGTAERFPMHRHSTRNIRCCAPSARRCSWKPHDFVTHSDVTIRCIIIYVDCYEV